MLAKFTLKFKQTFDSLQRLENIMDIEIDREVTPEGDLVFCIRVKNPQKINFSEVDKKILDGLDNFTLELGNTIDVQNRIYQEYVTGKDGIKEKIFKRCIKNLKFNIINSLETKFDPICQEIYNWIYLHQDDHAKMWLLHCDPQRTKYYFDNDRCANESLQKQESDHEIDVFDDIDDFDSDDQDE